MTAYSRENPSERYREILAYYKNLHEEGDVINNISAKETFDGRSLIPHVNHIRSLCLNNSSKTLLDYGSGKAMGYDVATAELPDGTVVKGIKSIWNIDNITFYDPGYAPYSTLPDGKFDAVISTDVLEHIPEEDIPWVLAEMFAYARQFLFCTIALYPAEKILPDGTNAHITLKDAGWWANQLEAASAKYNHSVLYSSALIDDAYARRRIFIESVST